MPRTLPAEAAPAPKTATKAAAAAVASTNAAPQRIRSSNTFSPLSPTRHHDAIASPASLHLIVWIGLRRAPKRRAYALPARVSTVQQKGGRFVSLAMLTAL